MNRKTTEDQSGRLLYRDRGRESFLDQLGQPFIFVNGREITFLHFVPALLAAFLEAPGVERCVSQKRRSTSPTGPALESLCEVLLETNQEQGVELFQTLLAQRQHARTVDHPTGVDMLALTLFRIPRIEHSQVLLREWLDTCSTDNTLFELALAAAADRLHQIGGVAVTAGLGHHQAGAGQERPEQLPDGDVEGDRRLLEDPVAGPRR